MCSSKHTSARARRVCAVNERRACVRRCDCERVGGGVKPRVLSYGSMMKGKGMGTRGRVPIYTQTRR
jgi:hypothetical protein